MIDKDSLDQIQKIVKSSIQPYQQAYQSSKSIMWNNFLGGIAWGLGVTVGLSVLFGILGFLVSRVEWVPVVGKFFSDTIKNIESEQPQVSTPRRPTPTPSSSSTPTPNPQP